jgi:hypothetical protein
MNEHSIALRGDRILVSEDEDRLGFKEVAARIAATLVEQRLESSIVLGLEGKWGSGKSSLMTLVLDRVRSHGGDEPTSIVHFSPWLVGDRDALLAVLFAELSAALDAIALDQGNATRDTLAKSRRAVDAVRNFARAASRAGEAFELAGTATSFPPLSLVGKGLKALDKVTGKTETKSLAASKAALVRALKDLDRRIIVTIDDLDRLEPLEAVEVLRLVRSVADLPNVIYLLCYDSDVLARSVESAANVADGQAFLEKIVQLTISVPQPEAFQLRFWFADELRGIAGSMSEEGTDRLRTVVDVEGGRRLTTPRAVNRALDAIRLLWPPLREQGADFADLVWLQLIRNGSPGLYRWIENYCGVAAEKSLGVARVDDEELRAQLDALIEAVPPDWFANIYYRHAFAEHLAGIEALFGKDEPPFSLFGSSSDFAHARAIAERRLASPDHYRLYFALADPSHALKQADFTAFWKAADDGPAAVASVLLDLHGRVTSRAIGQADLLLDRVSGGSASISSSRAENILLGFADAMDDAWRKRSFSRSWITSLWDRAQKMIPSLRRAVPPELRSGLVDRMFAQGQALDWLTDLYRRETAARGGSGQRAKSEDEWFFSAEEFERLSSAMNARYRALGMDAILRQIAPRSILFAWSQGGDAAAAKASVVATTASDEGFLQVLDVLRSEVGTTEGTYSVLKRENVEVFLDYDEVAARIDVLLASSDPEFHSLATAIRQSIDDADHF